MTGQLGHVVVTDHDDDAWIFSVDGLPETFTVRSVAADGTVLSEAVVTPDWVRMGGNERCGEPGEDTVTVQS